MTVGTPVQFSPVYSLNTENSDLIEGTASYKHEGSAVHVLSCSLHKFVYSSHFVEVAGNESEEVTTLVTVSVRVRQSS